MRQRVFPALARMAGRAGVWLETRFWKLAAIDPGRWWAALRTREGKVFAAIALAALLFGIADFITMPPPMPSYRQVVADWHPSEAWLYDRHGRLLDSARVNFAARRLGWTPLDKVSQVTRDTLIAAEDRRFYSHGGVDWLALAGAARDRVERRRSRGASTRSLALDPGLAPHLSDRLLTKPGLRITTTLDYDIQRYAIVALRRQLLGLGGARARDGAVVVLDNATGDVLAYVGGIGGNSTAPSVDGANAYRQAGSTLKPFLYAEAMEKGYLTPASILDDSPVQLDTASGLYVPQNYDRGFKGPVSARAALAGSLNVPAVRTLLLVGVEPFRDRLWDTGYRGLVEDGDYYGYSLALGSAEVTLLEQANAYRSLANAGRWAPLRLTAKDPREASRAITTPQAAWLVDDMLADPTARAATFGLDSALRLPFWAAVKTGTSKAMRDNWGIGFNDRYTVAVWVGNLEGDPMRAVSGTSGAATVWRDMLIALGADRRPQPPARPPGIEERNVTFAGNVEQPRREYFLTGTAMSRIAFAPAESRRPRITNPVSGSVYAIDPDIPADRQRLAVTVSGAAIAHRLMLDKRDIVAADSTPQILAAPGPHRLRLLDLGGHVVDQVLFTERKLYVTPGSSRGPPCRARRGQHVFGF